LDKEHHEESDDGRAGIYDQLPGVTEPEYGAANGPNQKDEHGRDESSRVSRGMGGPLSEAGE